MGFNYPLKYLINLHFNRILMSMKILFQCAQLKTYSILFCPENVLKLMAMLIWGYFNALLITIIVYHFHGIFKCTFNEV